MKIWKLNSTLKGKFTFLKAVETNVANWKGNDPQLFKSMNHNKFVKMTIL